MASEYDVAKVAGHPLAAGVVGALVGLRWAPGETIGGKVVNIGSGVAVAGYLGPLACEVFALQAQSAQSAVGFALGLFGLSMAGALMDGIKTLQVGEILAGWLRRKG